MFQWTEEVIDSYVRLMKSLSSECRRSNRLVLPLLLLGPRPMIVSMTINSGTICFSS